MQAQSHAKSQDRISELQGMLDQYSVAGHYNGYSHNGSQV